MSAGTNRSANYCATQSPETRTHCEEPSIHPETHHRRAEEAEDRVRGPAAKQPPSILLRAASLQSSSAHCVPRPQPCWSPLAFLPLKLHPSLSPLHATEVGWHFNKTFLNIQGKQKVNNDRQYKWQAQTYFPPHQSTLALSVIN